MSKFYIEEAIHLESKIGDIDLSQVLLDAEREVEVHISGPFHSLSSAKNNVTRTCWRILDIDSRRNLSPTQVSEELWS